MKCFHCDAQLTRQDVCLKCGTDVRLYKKILATSNHLYNEALYKARERDLTGAKNYLRQSLQLNKKNIDARNLLGLIYYELGEPAYAVREWVLSQNYSDEDNAATRYLACVEKDMHSITQSVKKYNQALGYIKSGNTDMALVALKQVISRPYGINRAKQLLALVYMEDGHVQKANKLLRECKALDAGDMTTRRYLEAIDERKLVNNGSYREAIANAFEGSGHEGVIIPEHNREYSSYFMSMLYVIIGMILGAGFVYYTVVPSVRNSEQRTNAANLLTFEDTISELRAQIATAEGQKNSLELQIRELNEQLANAGNEPVEQNYDVFLPVLTAYINDDVEEIINAMSKLDPDVDDSLYQNIYKRLLVDYADNMGDRAFYKGYEYNSESSYYKAMEQYKIAYKLLGENSQTVYYIGFEYEMIGDYTTALYFYEYAMKTYPDELWVGHCESRSNYIRSLFPDIKIPEITPGNLTVVGIPELWAPAQ